MHWSGDKIKIWRKSGNYGMPNDRRLIRNRSSMAEAPHLFKSLPNHSAGALKDPKPCGSSSTFLVPCCLTSITMAPKVTSGQLSHTISPCWEDAHILPKRLQLPRDTVELELDTLGLAQTNRPLQLTCVKAAWVLTLQCFRPTDVISFSYEDGCQTVYTVRVDPTWDVQTLLRLIEAAATSERQDVRACGVYASQFPAARNSCTASLCYFDSPQSALRRPNTKEAIRSKVIQV